MKTERFLAGVAIDFQLPTKEPQPLAKPVEDRVLKERHCLVSALIAEGHYTPAIDAVQPLLFRMVYFGGIE